MIFKNIIRSRHFERMGVSVTSLRSLSTFAIGFLLTGIISHHLFSRWLDHAWRLIVGR